MVEGPGFSVPHEIDEILERLPAQVTLNVPDHVLARWFPPGPVDEPTLERVRSYARSCGCSFGYHDGIRAGVFYKPMPSRE